MSIISLQPTKPGPLRALWHALWTPVILLVAFLPLALVNIVQIPSLLILPWSLRLYRAYNRVVAFAIWGYWAWGMERFIGMRLELSGDELPMREDAIVIVNHQTMADIIVILCIAHRCGRVGDCKWMVKDILKYVPGVGWGMLFLDCLFLKRDWADDEVRIRRTFSRFVRGKLPLWMVSFPEGTRRTPAKLAASRAYATKAGLTPTEHVLLPRPRGFAASVIGLREHVKAVYSFTIRYDHAPPSLTGMIRGDVARVRVKTRRYPIATLPTDELRLNAWLVADFLERDRFFNQ